MRKIIAALVMSVDGLIEGRDGELDWVETWEDPFDLLPQIDTCILGRGMYPGYEQYWGAVLADPEGILPFTGRAASKGEIDYANFAHKTPHIVLTKTLDQVAWKNTRIVRDVEEIRELKQQPGKDVYAVGGATLVSSLMNRGLIDELAASRSAHRAGGRKGPVQGRKGATCVGVSWGPAAQVGHGPSDLQHVTRLCGAAPQLCSPTTACSGGRRAPPPNRPEFSRRVSVF